MRKKVLISYEKLYETLNNIPFLRDKAFLCLTYACAGRVGEIVWGRVERTEPISKQDIQIQDEKIYVNILTEKVRIMRRVPISRVKEGCGANPAPPPEWLTQPILAYMHTIKEDYLFPYSTRWGEKVFEKWFGTQHIHLLRAWR